jgi:predicted transcriptional regulator
MAFTVRTDPEFEEALASLAQAEGASRQEVVRRAVIARYEQLDHETDVADSMSRMTVRWGDVLERLRSE